MVKNQLPDIQPATLSEQFSDWSSQTSPCNTPGSLILHNLQTIQQIILCATPETDLEDQFTAKDSISYHQPGFEVGSSTDNSKSIYSGSQLLDQTFVMILDILRLFQIILDVDSKEFFCLDGFDLFIWGVNLDIDVQNPLLLLGSHDEQVCFIIIQF